MAFSVSMPEQKWGQARTHKTYLKKRDKEEYLKRVKKYICKYNGKLYGYVIIDNHSHLLIEVSKILYLRLCI